MTEPNDLLDAVDTLTQLRIDHIAQVADDGTFIRSVPVTHPALLVWLEAAVTPSSNSDGGASTSARERNLIDSGALYDYVRIRSAIHDWCRIEGTTINRDLTVPPAERLCTNLRNWYIDFNRRTDYDTTGHLNELRRWARLIEDRMDPPKKLEIVTPCPVCTMDEWVDSDGVIQAHPLCMEYRKGESGEITRARVACRNPDCGAAWAGLGAIEELGLELDEKHAPATIPNT